MTHLFFCRRLALSRIRTGLLALTFSLIASGALLAEEAGHAAEGGGLNPLSFQTDLALWTGIVFLGLVLVLGKFAFRPIADALDAREKSMADKVAAADKANSDAKALLDTYQQKLADSEAEVRQLLDTARADAQKTGQEIVEKARAAAAEEHSKALREIEAASDKAMTELAAKSASLATGLAGKILQEKINPADHARLIDGALKEFSKN